MKQSGYRTTFHIYSIFFLSLLGTLLVVCCLFAMLITAPNPNGKNVRRITISDCKFWTLPEMKHMRAKSPAMHRTLTLTLTFYSLIRLDTLIQRI